MMFCPSGEQTEQSKLANNNNQLTVIAQYFTNIADVIDGLCM